MSRFISEYLAATDLILHKIAETEQKNLDRAAQLIADAYAAGKHIYIFGCTHSAILAEDVFYRAGAPVFWRPLWGPGMSIAQTPGFLTSAAEHNAQLGADVIRCSRIEQDDVLVVISTSGKNEAPLAVAETALQKGVRVIAVSSSAYKNTSPSLWNMQGLLMIDNHVPLGDASVKAGGVTPMGPLSTIAGSFIMHTISALAIEKLQAAGADAPVFLSSNAPGGRERNEELLAREAVREAFLLP